MIFQIAFSFNQELKALGTNDEKTNIKNTFEKAFEKYQQNNIANSNNIEYDNVNGKIQETNPRDLRAVQDIDTLYSSGQGIGNTDSRSPQQRYYDREIERTFNSLLQDGRSALSGKRSINGLDEQGLKKYRFKLLGKMKL